MTSSSYVHLVYHDAVGTYAAYGRVHNRPSMDVYEYIDTISKRTGDRLRILGAHADAARVQRTFFLIDYTLLPGWDVPDAWAQEWKDDYAASSRGLPYTEPTEIATRAFERAAAAVRPEVKLFLDSTFMFTILAALAAAGYKDVKGYARQRLSTASR